MTMKELLNRRNDLKRANEELIGLSILNYYIEKMEKETDFEEMENLSDVVYGFLVGLMTANYISKEDFDSLNKERIDLKRKILDR